MKTSQIIKRTSILLLLNFGFVYIAQSQIIANKSEGCSPLVVNFEVEENNFQSVRWVFGDGQTSNATSPTIIFEEIGVFDVSAILNRGNNEIDTLSIQEMITVSESPEAQFVVENDIICINQSVSFQNVSLNASEYQWSFGDGNQSTEENPVHQYEDSGNYTVTLTAKSSTNCQDLFVIENDIEVMEALEVSATVNRFTQCLQDNRPLTFNISGEIVEAVWNLGNGASASGSSIEFLYPEIGNYTVSVNYLDVNGCSGRIQLDSSINVIQTDVPQIVSSNTNVCLGQSIDFSANHPSVHGFEWIIDGHEYEGKNVSVSFNQPGPHDVLLRYSDSNSCLIEVFEEDFIVVTDVPQPAIEYEEFTGCAPFNFTAINQTEGASSFSWRVNGEIVNDQTINYTFMDHGTFEVVAITEYESGCIIEEPLSDRIEVFEEVTNLQVEHRQACAPFQTDVSLLNTAAQQIIWDNGDGETLEGPNVAFQYERAGVYFPSVSYINNNGCLIEYEFEDPIRVLSSSIPLSEPEVIESCTYTEVQFSGTMGYDYWEWSFGDGNNSTDQNPTHAYSEAGRYVVSLTTNNRNGCRTTIETYNIIEIPDLDPKATYEVIPGEKCGFFRTDLSADITDQQTARWFFNDSLVGSGVDLSLSFIAVGDVSVTLNIQSAGQCSKSKAIMIPNPWTECESPEMEGDTEEMEGDSPIGRFTFNSCNVPYSLDIVNPIPEATFFEWRFNDKSPHSQSSFTETYTSIGEYTIDYFAEFGKDSSLLVYDYITVNLSNPVIDFDYELKKVCDGFVVVLNPENPDFENYNWKINNVNVNLDENGSYFLANEGLYSVSLSAQGQSSCEATKIKNIYIGNEETQFNYPSALCLGDGFTITHNLMGYERFEWNMGNGETVENFDTEYLFSEAGQYQINLIAIDFEGCTYSYELPFEVSINNPSADFSANKTAACGETVVNFQNQSVGATSWLWDFGNGQTSTEENPEVEFQSGVYSISLVVANGDCRDSITYENLISIDELSSVFSYEYNQSCLPLTVSFQDESINAENWFWEFGDGSTSRLQNPTHTYYDVPTNKVKLTVENENGCRQLSEKELDFIFSANFQADANQICTGSQVTFSAISEDAVNWLWDFGDGATSTERNPSYVYNEPGIYNVSLIASNESGCQDTVIMTQFIEVSPYKADFELAQTVQSSCVPVQVEFTDFSEGAINYHWDFGDDKTSRVANPVHVYQQVGNFDVTLVITNKLGCKDTLKREKLVNVSGPETAFEIESKTICLPNTANFTDLSQSAVQWQWIFGDGNTSSEQNPQHLYDEPGIYDVTLIAQNEQGCEQIFEMSGIKVVPTPEVNFTMDISGECYPVEVSLTNESSNLLNPSYLWEFGDGQISTEENPTVFMQSTGAFQVSLTVRNDNACPVTLTHTDQIIVRDTVEHLEADLNQILVENNRVHFEFQPYNFNNISHYNVFRDSDDGFKFLQTVELEGTSNQRIIYNDQSSRPQDVSYKYIFQSVSFCDDTVATNELTIFNTILLQKEASERNTIDWNRSLGFTIDNQRIFRKLKGEAQWEEVAVMEPTAVSFIDEEDLCPGVYQYRVGAFEQNSLRSISNYVDFEISDEMYINQVAEIKNTTVLESGEVFTEWSIPEAGKGRITAFEIYRSENGGEFKYYDSVEPHEQFYIDEESATGNNSYSYQVKVINDCSVDASASEDSNTVLLQKNVQFRKYELRWNAFKGWEEGVKKYVIQRLNENGEWETVEEVSGNQLKTIIRDTEN